MMLVSIEGHAIFQTADCSGPSTIERSNRRGGAGAGGGASVGAASVGGCGARGRGGAARPAGLELT
jgi:hypothetical protein